MTREVARLIALVALIIGCAAAIIAFMILGALAVDAVASALRRADDRTIGAIAAGAICLVIIAGQAWKESK
jgi:hypothetical protein